ncbi:SxtJ family membrane protein [Gammaproteobacteria bacterium]|nr:SxtJ family membrane protein [Gammaproteobacteria bacterium]
MVIDKKKLPSDKNFGLFFSLILFLVSIYFYLNIGIVSSSIFLFFSFSLLSISYMNSKILHPLNKVWIKFGVLLGKVVSPIVLGGIFFLIFSPIALVMKIFGRDELLLKRKNKQTHWKTRSIPGPESSSFRNQF